MACFLVSGGEAIVVSAVRAVWAIYLLIKDQKGTIRKSFAA